MIRWLLCALNRHVWIDRGKYRRICRYCPRVEVWIPEEGWLEAE